MLSRNTSSDGALATLGSRGELESALAIRNTTAEAAGCDVLFGPGIELHLAPNQDPIMQMMLTISDEDIGWTVIMRIARDLHWKILDPNSGREFSP